jgi:hypothetical protein
MSQSIWPFDHFSESSYGVQKAIDELRCFVICPTEPSIYWDELYDLVRMACDGVGRALGVAIACTRAVDILSAGVIHPEIWRDLRTSDVIIADITGVNGNVMFELGVAAGWSSKERVILLRQDRQDEKRLFDINPARQLDYMSLAGDQRTLRGAEGRRRRACEGRA